MKSGRNILIQKWDRPLVKLLVALCLVAMLGACAAKRPRVSPSAIITPSESDVEAYIEAVDAEFPSPGFRGLHLGMSTDQVNDLVKATPWGYLIQWSGEGEGDVNWPDNPQFRPTAFLSGDHTSMGREWATLGCEPPEAGGDCHGLAYVYARFEAGQVVLINLAGPGVPPDRIGRDVMPWGRFALGDLTGRYGSPDKTLLPLDEVGRSSFQSGYEIPLYEWSRSGGGRIALYISEVDGLYSCGVILEKPDGTIEAGDEGTVTP